jgi:L-aminopeptidase/D-esterase-like protein
MIAGKKVGYNFFVLLIIFFFLLSGCATRPPHETGNFKETDLVELVKLDTTIKLDIRYATNNDVSETGSIIVVVATNAPLLPHQLKRLTQRVSLGIGKNGGMGGNGSGDIFIAFSTANKSAFSRTKETNLTMYSNDLINDFFTATIEATEEAIINALVAGKTMKGINDNTAPGLPHEAVIKILKKYNRIK